MEQAPKVFKPGEKKLFIGNKVGKWTIIEEKGWRVSASGKTKSRVLLCSCECGTTKEVLAAHLNNGKSSSCHECTEKVGSAHHHWKGAGEISGNYWSNVIRRARGRKKKGGRGRQVPVEITVQDAWDLFLKQNRKCALTGQLLYFPKDHKALQRGDWNASLDKIDNGKGYVPGNIQWLHKDINMLKNTFTQKRFVELCTLVHLNYKPMKQPQEQFDEIITRLQNLSWNDPENQLEADLIDDEREKLYDRGWMLLKQYPILNIPNNRSLLGERKSLHVVVDEQIENEMHTPYNPHAETVGTQRT